MLVQRLFDLALRVIKFFGVGISFDMFAGYLVLNVEILVFFIPTRAFTAFKNILTDAKRLVVESVDWIIISTCWLSVQ